MLKLVKAVIGLVVISSLFFFGSRPVSAQSNRLKIIPAFFGQNQKKASWFWYQLQPGQSQKINLTLINLSHDKLKGRLKIKLKPGIKSKSIEFDLPSEQRQNLNLNLSLSSQIESKEYVLAIQAEDQSGDLLAEVPLTLVVGRDLKPKFEVKNITLKPTNNWLALNLELNNTGQLSLTDIKIKVKYRNKWWFGLAKEEEFSLDKHLAPGKKLKLSQNLNPPAGIFGPVDFQLVLTANGLVNHFNRSLFWFPAGRIIIDLGYFLFFLLALFLAFKFIFKGLAGLMYRYLKNKLAKKPARQHSNQPDDLNNLLIPTDLNGDYSQLLLDIRQIVREEMKLQQKLILAEREKQASQLLIELVKEGHLKLIPAKSKISKAKKKKS